MNLSALVSARGGSPPRRCSTPPGTGGIAIPDISDADPALHYLLVGAAEGRSPGPDFDGEWYLRRHPDVLMRGENPLLHYIERGRSEGRDIASVASLGCPACRLRTPIIEAGSRTTIR